MLIDWVKKNVGEDKETKLMLRLEKIVPDRFYNGNDARYFTVFIKDKNNETIEITQMVADTLALKVSKAKDAYGSLIVHGCGMDMGFYIQNEIFRVAFREGYKEMFSEDDYIYLGYAKDKYPVIVV